MEEKIKFSSDDFLKYTAGIIMVVVSIIITIKMFCFLFDDKKTIDGMNSETLLGLITVLVAFGGVSSYIFHKIILIKVREEIKEDYKKERMMSRGDINHIIGLMDIRFYKMFYREATKSEDEKIYKGEALKRILEAIDHGKERLAILNKTFIEKRITDQREKRFYYIAKNNMAYYLERKWNYYRDKMTDDDFREYLKKEEKELEYKAEKEIATALFQSLKEEKATSCFTDMAETFKATEIKLKNTFSI